MQDHVQEEEFDIKKVFVPFTTSKAIHWIIIIGLVVFANSLFNNFLGDDEIYILNNSLSHVINLSNAFGPSIFNTAGQYRPIPALYFSILYTLFGTNAFYYHILQLLLHIGCAILLFILFRKFFSLSITFFCVLVFLIHPIQVESVSYISQTVSELFFLFGISAFLLSLQKKISLRTLIIIGILLLFSFLTKETGMLFFLLIVMYSFLFNRKNILKFSSVGFVSIVVYVALRYFVGHVSLDTRQLSPIAMMPLPARLLSFPEIGFYYFKAVVFPIALAYDQQWVITSIDFANFYLPLVVDSLFLIFISTLGLVIFKKQNRNIKLFLFFCIWFFSGLFMIMQIYPLDATVADRWFYFPLVGLLGIFGVSINLAQKRLPYPRKIWIMIAVFVLILLSLRTIVRNSNWSDGITLFSHDIKISDNSNIEENLAYELILAQRYKDSLVYLQKSVKTSPHASNLYVLGYVYEQLHDYQKAEYYYSLNLKQTDMSDGQDEVREYTYEGMAKMLVLDNNPKTAKPFLEEATKLYSNIGVFWAYLAITDYTLGNQKQALYAAEKAKPLLHNASVNLLYYRIYNKKPLNLHI